MQLIIKHRIGLKPSKVNVYLSYQIVQNLMFFVMYFLWLPIFSIFSGSLLYLATIFLSDVIVVASMVMFVVMRTGRNDLMAAFPAIYAMRFVALWVFIRSFTEVVILGKFRSTSNTWERVTRQAQTVV